MPTSNDGSGRLSERTIHVVAVVAVLVVVPVAATSAPWVVGADRTVVGGDGAAPMRPTVTSHHAVFLERVPAGDVERGDVIAYRSNDSLAFRRVALVTSHENETAFIVKGEAEARPVEDPVLASQVRGRVVHSLPFVGRVLGELRSLPGLGRGLPAGLAVYDLLAWLLLVGVLAGEGRLLATRADRDLTASDGALVLTRADLTATTITLGAFAAFSLGVVVVAPSPATLAVAILATGLFGYALVLRRGAPPAVDGDERPETVSGSLERTAAGRTSVTVESPDALVGMAAAADRPLAVDPGAEACFVPHGDVVYVCETLPALAEEEAGRGGRSDS